MVVPVPLIVAPDGDVELAGDKPAIGEEMVGMVFTGGPVPSTVAAASAFVFSEWLAMVTADCAIVEGPAAVMMVEVLDMLSVIVFADLELSTMASVEIVIAEVPASGIVDATGPATVTLERSFVASERVFHSDLSSASSMSL